MIDLHTHVLPGLDDGAQTLDDALGFARQAVAEGITTVVATPHVRNDYPTTADQMELALAGVREELARRDVRLDVLPGGEIDHEQVTRLGGDELHRFTLGQTGRYILLEFPYHGWPAALDRAFAALLDRGFVPVLAHPERNFEVQERPARLEPLVESGALVQVTAASLAGVLGRSAQATARRLVELGFFHVLASDAHPPALRSGSLLPALNELHDERLSAWATTDVPAAVLRGEDLPARPAARRRLGRATWFRSDVRRERE